MPVHVSPNMSQITISTTNGFLDFMKVKVAARHLSYRTLFYSVLLLAFLWPFIFIFTAVITLDDFEDCTSFDCLGQRLGPRILMRENSSPITAKEMFAVLLLASNEALPEGMVVPESFNDLVAEMRAHHYDPMTFSLMLKAMVTPETKVNIGDVKEVLCNAAKKYNHIVMDTKLLRVLIQQMEESLWVEC